MRLVAGLAALLVVLGFPGCDGENGGGSKQTFAERADAVCSEAELEISRVARPQDPNDLLQLALFLERATPLARRQNERLRRLARPAEQAAQIERLLEALEAEVAAAERMQAAARREDRAGVQAALRESQAATAASRQAAQELGLLVCGSGN